jgi:hypothetical protein
MPISVVCPGCHKRFSVSEKFAGKKGPCPKCKTVIKVPDKSDEVVVHTPDQFGPKGVSGRAVLKPIARAEVKFSIPWAIAIAAAFIILLIGAWVLRSPEGNVPTIVLALGAVLLAPPLVFAGYTFLRDDELEPHRGKGLLLRVAICSVVYAGLWGGITLIANYLFEGEAVEVYHMVWIVPFMVGIGGFASFASLDLDFLMASVHYGLYLVLTIALRLIMGLDAVYPVFWG